MTRRFHIARATDWKDAIITVLASRSPYRPWRLGSTDAHKGDAVAFVLDTDPPSILAERVEVEEGSDPIPSGLGLMQSHATLLDVATVATSAGLSADFVDGGWLEGDDAARLETVLEEGRYDTAPTRRFGHTRVAAARTLLRFWGGCDGCEQTIDLTGPDTRDEVFVHTVDADGPAESAGRWSPLDDWPAVMCRGCRDRMASEGVRSFVDFKFALHPACPACRARRTQATFYGMPSDYQNIEPWSNAAGCCVSAEEWYCSVCQHEW